MLLSKEEVVRLLADPKTDQVSLENGKYKIICNQGIGAVLRHDEPWRILTKYDISILYRIQELEEQYETSNKKMGEQ